MDKKQRKEHDDELVFLCVLSYSLTTKLFLLCVSFYSIINCGLLAVKQLTAWQPHNLKRERLGLSRYGLKPGRVE